MVSRRRVLQLAGAGLGSGAVVSGTASASHDLAKPDHVTLSYDVDVLETHRPRFVLEESDKDLLVGQYGWLATSSEHDTDICVY